MFPRFFSGLSAELNLGLFCRFTMESLEKGVTKVLKRVVFPFGSLRFCGRRGDLLWGSLGVFIFSEIVFEGGFDFVLDFVLGVWGE